MIYDIYGSIGFMESIMELKDKIQSFFFMKYSIHPISFITAMGG